MRLELGPTFRAMTLKISNRAELEQKTIIWSFGEEKLKGGRGYLRSIDSDGSRSHVQAKSGLAAGPKPEALWKIR